MHTNLLFPLEEAGSYRVLFLIISYYGAILGTMPVITTKTNSLVLLGLVSSSPGRQELFNGFWVANSMCSWVKRSQVFLLLTSFSSFITTNFTINYSLLRICRNLVSNLAKRELLDFCWVCSFLFWSWFRFALATKLWMLFDLYTIVQCQSYGLVVNWHPLYTLYSVSSGLTLQIITFYKDRVSSHYVDNHGSKLKWELLAFASVSWMLELKVRPLMVYLIYPINTKTSFFYDFP